MTGLVEKNGDQQRVICYTISGLGGTPNVFQKLTLPANFEINPVEWIANLPGERLRDYSIRLLPQIDSSKPFVIIGFSFGAALAVEIARQTAPLLVVLISGVACRREIPFYLKYARAFGTYKLAPWIVKMPTPLLRPGIRFAFGTKDPAALDLLVQMVQQTDPHFYQWGLEALMDWQNNVVPPNLFHIHGGRDHLLPARYVNPDVILRDGGHFIVYTHGLEIGNMIKQHFVEAHGSSNQ